MNPKSINELANMMICRLENIRLEVEEIKKPLGKFNYKPIFLETRLERLCKIIESYKDELRGRNFDMEARKSRIKKYWAVQARQVVWEDDKKIYESSWFFPEVRKARTREDARDIVRTLSTREKQYYDAKVKLNGKFSGSYYEYRIVWRPVENLGPWRGEDAHGFTYSL